MLILYQLLIFFYDNLRKLSVVIVPDAISNWFEYQMVDISCFSSLLSLKLSV